jgi:hypothetical protein
MIGVERFSLRFTLRKLCLVIAATSPAMVSAQTAPPTINDIDNCVLTQGQGEPTEIKITGTGFTSDSTVRWNGELLAQRQVTPTTVIVSVDPDKTKLTGLAFITVSNQNGISNSVGFTIVPTGVGEITGISPCAITAGAPNFKLTLYYTVQPVVSTTTGFVFTSTTTVNWSGQQSLTATVSTPGQATVQVPSMYVAYEGFAFISVSNGETESAEVVFGITPRPRILTETLTSAVALQPYSQTLIGSGGRQPYTWSSTNLPPGLKVDPTTGLISGAPMVAGAFTFDVTLTDSTLVTFARTFTLAVGLPLEISTASLPSVQAGSDYSVKLEGLGGVPPYTWSTLPDPPAPGLAIDPIGGTISGVPTMVSVSDDGFTVQVRLTDATRLTVMKEFKIEVTKPSLSAVAITVRPGNFGPAEEPVVEVTLDQPVNLPVNGHLDLKFKPDPDTRDDPSVQLYSDGRASGLRLPLRIDPGAKNAVFLVNELPVGEVRFRSGTIAGNIDMTVSLTAAGIDVTPTVAPSKSFIISRLRPIIGFAQIVDRPPSGFDVIIDGYSTPLDVTQATFAFTAAPGKRLQASTVQLPVSTLFSNWYRNTDQAPDSFDSGSLYRYTQPFTLQGDPAAIGFIKVTLTNDQGTSEPYCIDFGTGERQQPCSF